MDFIRLFPENNSFVTITLFHYPDKERLWAMKMMYYARKYLRKTEGLRFWKLVGSGKSFGPLSPDFSTFGLIASWENAAFANAFFTESELIKKYRDHTDEEWTIAMLPYQSKGKWKGIDPFSPVAPRPAADKPIAVLTRGAIKWHKIIPFWKNEPAISKTLQETSEMIAYVGLGELPIIRQITFTLWENEAAMDHFAAHEKPHKKAAEKAWNHNYFSEALFSRFIPVAAEGKWKGINPLKGKI